MPTIAKVVVEIALDREFDYLVPDSLAGQVRLGSRVLAPFGHSMARGYVVGLCDHSERANLKTIKSLIGDKPLLSENMLKLARWLSEYYVSTIEQCIRTVLPCAIRRHGAKFKEHQYVLLDIKAQDAAAVEKLRSRSPKQAHALDILKQRGEMPLAALLKSARTSATVVQNLAKKNFVKIGRQTARRDPLAEQVILPTGPLKLFPQQADALAMVKKSIDTLQPPVVLLHGVTGSGKTEVYLQAIRYMLDQGKGAIMLVPEISLTPQTVERFRSRFGEAIAVLHSHLSDGERHDEWYRIYNGQARIVIGARSALFAPVDDLGLIVVDEEHETSYKQSETPRYNARDVAIMRGRMEKCAVLLGSASPSLESFLNIRKGKYELAELKDRVDHRPMPVMRIVDMRIEAQREGRANIFSRALVDAIRNRLDRSEQTMLFLNRRGFATSILCPLCGFTATCDQCSVGLTYHRKTEDVRCHLCGRSTRVPQTCPKCKAPTLKFAGIGTQRIEAIVHKVFPKAAIQRMDSDTTTQKLAHNRILGDFKSGKTDILIGTQMIAKGLHFPGVTLVGVIYADLSLHMADFRAAERTFQLLLQVAGRAGRGEIPGEVIVQTFSPFHPAIQSVRSLDYHGFCDQELESRRELSYPPFSHLTCLTLEGVPEGTVAQMGETLCQSLKTKLPAEVIIAGPIPAPLSKIKGRYRYQVILRSVSAKAVSVNLKGILRALPCPKDVKIAVDVDAISIM